MPVALLLSAMLQYASADERGSQPPQAPQIAANSVLNNESQSSTPAPPPAQQWSFTLGGLYTQRSGETTAWAPSLQVDYAPADRWQLHAMAPFVFDRLSGFGDHYGLGDFELGVRYRFIDDDQRSWRPAVAFYPLVDFPTGDASRNLGTGRTHAFLPLWMSKTVGAWIPYGGGGYWINPGPNNRNWGFAAAGVIRVLSDAWYVNGEVFYAGSSKVALKQQTGFNVGAHYNFDEYRHVTFTVGRGLQNATATNQFTGYLAFVLTY